MSQPNHKSQPTAEEAEARRRSGTRRIDVADASEPVSVPRAPRLPSMDWPTRIDQDHVPTQPEHDVPSTEALTLPAPASRGAADVQLPDDDDDRDTIPSPAPQND